MKTKYGDMILQNEKKFWILVENVLKKNKKGKKNKKKQELCAMTKSTTKVAIQVAWPSLDHSHSTSTVAGFIGEKTTDLGEGEQDGEDDRREKIQI